MLILKIWKKEELPADWENSIICPICTSAIKAYCAKGRILLAANLSMHV
jgi:hypothetical protein